MLNAEYQFVKVASKSLGTPFKKITFAKKLTKKLQCFSVFRHKTSI